MRSLLVTSALATAASAQNFLGFNSGSQFPDRSAKFKSDWVAEFTAAQGLENAPGTFNAVRLYTNIQAYSQDDPIEAFEAAIETNTSVLLGVWASETPNIDKEISALKKAIDKFGTKFTDRVIGISIGSEDLYRNSETGVINKAGPGASVDTILGFMSLFRRSFADTPLSRIPVGHVDTWDAWTNGTNKPVLDASDFLGVNEFPYYETGKGNDIKNAGRLFDRAFNAVAGVAGDKPIWLTETGWPTSGPNWDLAIPSVDNAKYYWNEVGCRKLFNKVPTFWYILRDSNPDNKMQFTITKDLSTKPLFDLTCPTTFDTPNETATPSSGSTGTPSPSSTGGSGGTRTTTGPNSATTSPNGAPASLSASAATYGLVAIVGAYLAVL